MKLYDAIIWDIDGTLLATAEGLVAAYEHCTELLSLPRRSREELASYIGPVPQDIFRQKYGMEEQVAQEATKIFRTWYKQHGLRMARPYEGIMEVLNAFSLAGIPQAIATNKRQDYAQEICDIFGISRYCKPILGADDAGKSTKAQRICQCVETLSAKHAVMIGDTEGDKRAAGEAGVDFLGVNYGYSFHNVLGFANTPREIFRLLVKD